MYSQRFHAAILLAHKKWDKLWSDRGTYAVYKKWKEERGETIEPLKLVFK